MDKRRTLGALRDSIFGLALEPLIDSFLGDGGPSIPAVEKWWKAHAGKGIHNGD